MEQANPIVQSITSTWIEFVLLLWGDERLLALALPHLPVSTRSAVSQVNTRTLLHSGLSSNVQNLSSHYDRGYREEAAQSDLSCFFCLFLKWLYMGPHPPKSTKVIHFGVFFFLALPPIPVPLACLGFQQGAPEVRWLHASGCLLWALSAPSGLLHTVSAGHHGTETQRCSSVLVSSYSHNRAEILGVWATFSRLLRCPRLIKVMPSCLQIRYSCASASSARALVASSKTEKIKVRQKEGDLGIVWSGSPLKMKATINANLFNERLWVLLRCIHECMNSEYQHAYLGWR